MANRGPNYGLSLEIELKTKAKFNLEDCRRILTWLEQCTGLEMRKDPSQLEDDQDVCDVLKDGVQLCCLMEKIGAKIRYIKKPLMPFHMMENISTFLTAAKLYGVPEISLFQTVDLYENKQLYKVFECLRALGALVNFDDHVEFFRTAYKNGADIPYNEEFMVKIHDKNPRKFDSTMLKLSETLIPMQQGSNKWASQKGMQPYGLGRQILPD